MDPDPPPTGFPLLQSQGVIDVAGVVVIDGHATLVGEIQPLGITGQRLATAVHQPFGLPFELSGKACAPGGAGQRHQMVRIPLLQRHQQMTQQATVDALVRTQMDAGEAVAQPWIELGLLQAAAGQLLQLFEPLLLLRQQGL